MDIQIATDRLATLAASANRPKIAQLRDVFDKVETAICSGVSYTDIIQTLDDCGLHFTYQTFAAALKRIRRERGIVASRSRASGPSTVPVSSDAKKTSNEVPVPTALRRRPPIVPVGARLPDDWLTGDLTREQKRLLTHEQRRARADAVVKDLWPNPFDPVPPEKSNPA